MMKIVILFCIFSSMGFADGNISLPKKTKEKLGLKNLFWK